MLQEDFCSFLKSIGIRHETGEKLWAGNVKSPQELASVDEVKLQEIVDDPLLLNTIFPVLRKYAFPITMANDPCKKAIALMRKHAGEDMEVDPPPNVQDGVQSDTSAFVGGSFHTGPVTEPLHQNDISSTTMIINDHWETSQPPRVKKTTNQGSTKNFVITGGNFAQANIGGDAPVTYNNTNTTIAASSTVETLEQRRNRRKVKLNPGLIQLEGFTFSTSSLRIGEEPEYWPDDETVTKVTQHRFKMDTVDSNIYPVQPWNSNQALLINITEFAKSSRSGAKEVSPRQGAEVDAKQLQPVLEQLGFEVTLCLNKRKVEIEQCVREYWAKLQNKNPSMSLVFIGSHGERMDNNDRFLSYDGIPMRVSNIIDQLNGRNCFCMVGKPKIFLFQFCRQNTTANAKSRAQDQRNNSVGGFGVHSDATREVEVNNLPPVAHSEADMLQAYATAAGNKAYRDVKEGSWFVTALCKVLKEQAHSEDLLSMLTKVNSMVKTNASRENNEVAVQLSQFYSTLSKKLRFYPQ